ncbi:MAG: hypothetical protein ABIY70_25560 [Capsulimonas sp.]|uniref:hypothetical protein n=1 Tax=Capsulimonas sp. TaxID=2494211 RepID=UPI003264645E
MPVGKPDIPISLCDLERSTISSVFEELSTVRVAIGDAQSITLQLGVNVLLQRRRIHPSSC